MKSQSYRSSSDLFAKEAALRDPPVAGSLNL